MTTGKLKVLSAAALIAVAGAVQAAVSQPRHVTIEYEYAKDGEIVSRKINGAVQRYEYDLRGQLTGVYDVNGKAVESYNYDAAGNILKKTVDGKTTTFKYDAANQLVSKEDAAGLVAYEYDAAGRMVREGDKQYKYSYLDKITSVLENGETAATMDYFVGGQLASVTRGLDAEKFIWDGLALVHRDGSDYLNEPSIGGGNPVASNGKVMLNDMLGNTVAVKNDEAYCTTSMTAFGESTDSGAFFTGKPFVGELGYAFLMRSYRPENGKWQTADPLGYPDGWNQLAYCNNQATSSVDLLGCSEEEVVTDSDNGAFYGTDYYNRWAGLDDDPDFTYYKSTPFGSGLCEYTMFLEAVWTGTCFKDITTPFEVLSVHSFVVVYYDRDPQTGADVEVYRDPVVPGATAISIKITYSRTPTLNGTRHTVTAAFTVKETISGKDGYQNSILVPYTLSISRIAPE